MYYITWRGATQIRYFVPSNHKYDCHTFKPGNIGFRHVIFPINVLPKQKRAMRNEIIKPQKLKEINHASCMFGLNEYLNVLPGGEVSQKMVRWN